MFWKFISFNKNKNLRKKVEKLEKEILELKLKVTKQEISLKQLEKN